MKQEQLPALTSIRFFAALAVLVCHWCGAFHRYYLGPGSLSSMLLGITANGSMAVNLFFILSGLVLGLTNLDAQGRVARGFGRYLWARVARIYPLYVLAWVLAAAPYQWEYGQQIAPVLHPYAGITTLLLVQDWVPIWSGYWNGPGWTLGVEAWCYLMLPLLAALVAGIPHRWLVPCCALLWLGTLAPGLLIPNTNSNYGPYLIVTSTVLPIWYTTEFSCGLVLARLYRERRSDRAMRLALPAALVILGTLLLGRNLPSQLEHHGILDPAFLVLLFALACGGGRWLAHPLLVLLGDASYALYLLHWPLWSWLHQFRLLSDTPEGAAIPAFVAYALIAISCAVLVHLLVERPVRRWLLAHPPGAQARARAGRVVPRPAP